MLLEAEGCPEHQPLTLAKSGPSGPGAQPLEYLH